jgi:hypothetical protein
LTTGFTNLCSEADAFPGEATGKDLDSFQLKQVLKHSVE